MMLKCYVGCGHVGEKRRVCLSIANIFHIKRLGLRCHWPVSFFILHLRSPFSLSSPQAYKRSKGHKRSPFQINCGLFCRSEKRCSIWRDTLLSSELLMSVTVESQVNLLRQKFTFCSCSIFPLFEEGRQTLSTPLPQQSLRSVLCLKYDFLSFFFRKFKLLENKIIGMREERGRSSQREDKFASFQSRGQRFTVSVSLEALGKWEEDTLREAVQDFPAQSNYPLQRTHRNIVLLPSKIL